MISAGTCVIMPFVLRDEHKLAYKPPDVSLFGKTVEMKFKVESGKIQWFKGQVMNYDGHTGKYGIYFPSDGETVYVFPDDKDMRFIRYLHVF